MNVLPVLPVVVPLLGAALLAAAGRWIPERWGGWVSILVASAVCALALWLAQLSWAQPIVYWMGGWRPRGDIALGICFVVEPIGAGLAAITAFLTACAFLFSSRYFDTVR